MTRIQATISRNSKEKRETNNSGFEPRSCRLEIELSIDSTEHTYNFNSSISNIHTVTINLAELATP